MPSYKILHAEDDPEWAELLSARLASTPYQVFRAATGQQAVSLAGRIGCDLAILDIKLPDMSGHDLCRKLRELPGLERLPVIVLSSHPLEKVKSLKIGADAFVSKISGAAEILPTMEALVRRVQMDTGVLLRGDLRLDPRGNAVFLEDRLVATLTRKEFVFFYALVKKSPEPLSKDELTKNILHQEGDADESRSMEMLATRTRKRLGKLLAGRISGSRKFGWLYLSQPLPEQSAKSLHAK